MACELLQNQTEVFKEPYEYDFSSQRWPYPPDFYLLSKAFSDRSVTYDGDALRAFSAILDIMSIYFPGGFFFATPEYYFDVALCWRHRKLEIRRKMFPSWSWIAWNSKIELPLMHEKDKPSRFPHVMTKWRKRRTGGSDLMPLDNSYSYCVQFVDNEDPPVPERWTRVRETDSENRVRYSHPDLKKVVWGNSIYKPIPIVSSNLDQPLNSSDGREWEPYLYGPVEMATAPLGEAIKDTYSDVDTLYKPQTLWSTNYDPEGNPIGIMESAEPRDFTKWEPIAECEVIALIAMTRKPEDNLINTFISDITLDLLQKILRDQVASTGIYSFVEALWVEGEGNIAYRKGIGRIGRREWINSMRRRLILYLFEAR
ncbi:hypothetical protein K432DRAFT_411304 [Lepidopterella palustris CBS 459.81]|uniref:Uncharacterized protein n=1 Tax=Lepidopterella palustris CBS 459.81 TaxID=1314670 RepID=A0A8E2J8M8_9PEZI|nr:hypothetical protein K432DRAFT_411304 [Lepidopterella palustris CBS 459.81]